MRINDLKSMETAEVGIETLILAQKELQTIDDGYQANRAETPEWVTNKLAQVSSAINANFEAVLRAKLKTAQARRAALATPDEKRKVLDAEIEVLEAKLA